jgi:hypothetical protein
MNQERQPRSIVFHSPVHASLPVAGTDRIQGPKSGPVGIEGSPVAGSRAKSQRLCRADVALGSSAPSDTAWKLKRIEGRPDCASRGRISEMPEASGIAIETTDQASTKFIAAGPSLGSDSPGEWEHGSLRLRLKEWHGGRPWRRFPLPLPSIAHRLWPHQIHGPGRCVDDGDRIGPSNLGDLRLKVKRPMATATGMAPGGTYPRPTLKNRKRKPPPK